MRDGKFSNTITRRTIREYIKQGAQTPSVATQRALAELEAMYSLDDLRRSPNAGRSG